MSQYISSFLLPSLCLLLYPFLLLHLSILLYLSLLLFLTCFPPCVSIFLSFSLILSFFNLFLLQYVSPLFSLKASNISTSLISTSTNHFNEDSFSIFLSILFKSSMTSVFFSFSFHSPPTFSISLPLSLHSALLTPFFCFFLPFLFSLSIFFFLI